MKLMSISGMMVAAAVMAAASPDSVQAIEGARDPVKVIGCAVKGTGYGDGFLLANTVEQTTRTKVTPDAITSTTSKELEPPRVLYWLDDDDDVVESLMGQLVELTGEVEGDVKRGEIEVERENGMIELEIKAGDRKANVKLPDVPSAVGAPGSARDRETELPYRVLKLDVKSARSIAPSCR